MLRSLSVLRSRYAESTSSPRKDSTPARGGQVITSLGSDAPNVVGLVYIAGFGLDEGESIGALLQQGPPTPAVANVDIDSEGFAWIPEDDFLGHFAADIDPVKARVMYAVQQPLHLSTFDDVMGVPAWKSLPSWYLVAQNDEVIPPDAERQFAQRMGADTIEVASGHCAMVSHPEETHERIVTAANAAETRAPAAPLDGGPCPIRARRRVPWLQCRSSARTREESGPGGTCLRVLDLPRDREGLTEPLTFLAIELVDVRLDALAVRRVQPGDEFLPLLAERVLTPFLTEVAATPETVGGGVGDVEREAGEVAELAHRGRAVVHLQREREQQAQILERESGLLRPRRYPLPPDQVDQTQPGGKRFHQRIGRSHGGDHLSLSVRCRRALGATSADELLRWLTDRRE